MNLTIQELNEIYYALGVSSYKGMFVDQKVNESASKKIMKEMERVNNLSESSQPKAEVVKEVKKEATVIEPIVNTGSDVADFLITAASAIQEGNVDVEESTEEVVEPIKKAKFPGAKKSNLMDPEK